MNDYFLRRGQLTIGEPLASGGSKLIKEASALLAAEDHECPAAARLRAVIVPPLGTTPAWYRRLLGAPRGVYALVSPAPMVKKLFFCSRCQGAAWGIVMASAGGVFGLVVCFPPPSPSALLFWVVLLLFRLACGLWCSYCPCCSWLFLLFSRLHIPS